MEASRQARSASTTTRLLQALCALLYASYFLHLQSDFPNQSPWNDWAKFTDEGWYGGAALHRLQTGHWYIKNGFNPAVGLPAWPLLLAGWFTLTAHFFETTIAAARTLTLLLFGGSLLLLHRLLRPHTGPLLAAIVTVLILLNPYTYAFDRLAILEPLVVFLYLLALQIATLPNHAGPQVKALRALATGALLTAAILTKTTAIVLGPALLYQLWATHHHTSKKGRLALPAIAAITAFALWLAYFYAAIRPHHLADFHQLFLINNGHAHGRILPQVMLTALRDTTWINPILLPLTLLLLLASTRFFRPLWRIPLWTSSVLALVATVGFIGWHTWFQPRYYLLAIFPAITLLALGTQALRIRTAQTPTQPWRLAQSLTTLTMAIAALTMAAKTAAYLLHPTYTFRDTATAIAAEVRHDPSHRATLLAGSGDTLTLFNGIPAVNPEWPLTGLPALLAQEQPGWFAAFLPLENSRIQQLRTLYTLRETARYHPLDDTDHQTLILYRLDPLPPASTLNKP